MGLGPRLDLRQSQSLVMTPQLQQAIRLLALSNLEVESFIAEELERNPLLDTGGADDTAPAAEAAPEATEPATSDEPMLEGGGDGALDLDLNDENIHQDSAADRALDGGLALEGIGGGGSEGEGPDFDSFEAGDVSLHEHLVAQAGERLGPADFLIARMIIEQIEETGWLSGSLLDIASRLSVPLAEVERVLAVVQGFEPAGVA
ncbi:MAG TPA: RNA polymerase sigma-54 factor, partial [Allosphingosinicella sp.]|nr:RNA polymerase sigma-54 factor [Allosphingosinicella sp.]